MIEVVFAGVVYTASLIGCYDGDTCKLKFDDAPARAQSVQSVRFAGFDTPEIKGECSAERKLARTARDMTREYMKKGAKLSTRGERDRYGRLLVTAPDLRAMLIEAGVARKWKGRRESWC